MTRKSLKLIICSGPGCGSVGDGFLSVGPFITTANAHGLQRNPYSWIKGWYYACNLELDV